MIGQTIAGYQVLDEIGSGGMGVVYKARHARLRRLVAVKLLRPDRVADESRRRRFLHEARAASALNHPGIVTIHDIVTHDGADVIVMELVEGAPLDRRIPRGGLPWREAADLARDLAEAMAAAHAAGLVHRDLKPANVMVTPEGRIKVLDFGVAKLIPGLDGLHEANRDDATWSELTEIGGRPGTPVYMAPEQLLGEPVDRRTDVFAFGSLVYLALTGQRPFRGHNPAVLAAEILHGDPCSVRGLRPDVPTALAALVDKALAKQPAKRHQSMDEIAAELRSLLSPGDAGEPGRIAAGVTLKTLVASDLVESTLAEVPGGGGSEPEDLGRVLSDLVARHQGREVRTASGRLLLFELPWNAVRFALAFHRILAERERATGTQLESRVAIHLGEVTVGRGDGDEDAWTFDVEHQALTTAARLLSLAGPRQTLLTHGAFDLARRGAVREDSGADGAAETLGWLAHGDYLFPGDETVEVFEVGAEGFAPLSPPAASAGVARAPAGSKILGWRPAPGLTVPQRPNWVLERKLGEGGFGEVWLAGQAKTHERRVFKFCYEAEQLRSLKREITVFRLLKEELGERGDVARVLDWNLDQAPYFIESAYTEGGSLAEWAAAQGGIGNVPLAERLEIVAQVATALEAAHSVGVLHKDVKPANVLIKPGREGRPRAVLTDFGVGLITDRERLAARGITVLGMTEGTGDGSTTPGTHLYMAPELLTGRAPTIQSDVYALGVVLYQVVVGDLERPLAPGWERDVDDELLREDIAAFADGRPRHRPRSTLEVAERLRTLDARRAAREAERRARQAAERAARRRRLLAVTGAVSAVFLVVVSVLALQAVRARADAERGRAQAEQLIDVLLGDLHESLEKLGRLDLLEQAARGSQAYFNSLDEREEPSAVAAKRGITLLNIGDVLLKQSDTAAARDSYDAARQLFATSSARDPASYELRDGLRRSRVSLGRVLASQGETTAALETLRAALAEAESLVAREPRDERRGFGIAECQFWICLVLNQAGKTAEALAACGSAVENLASIDAAGEVPWRHPLLMLDTQTLIAGILRVQNRGDAALEELGQARLLAQRLALEDPENAVWPRKLAWVHFQTGVLRLYHQRDPTAALVDLGAARDVYQRLSATDPTQARWRENLADVLSMIGEANLQRGEARAALEIFIEAVETLERLVADDPSHRSRLIYLARMQQSKGRAYAQIGDFTAAIESFAAAVELNARVAAAAGDDPDPQNLLSWSHVVLGDGYAHFGERDRARQEWARALEIIEPVTARSDSLWYRDTHAQALLKLGRTGEARPLVEALLADGWDSPGFLKLVREAGLGSLVP